MSCLLHMEGWTAIGISTVVILCLCFFPLVSDDSLGCPVSLLFLFKLDFLATAFRFAGDTHISTQYEWLLSIWKSQEDGSVVIVSSRKVFRAVQKCLVWTWISIGLTSVA